ncbi:ABC transporter [Fulvivirga imtechensis AK7]|uniref:ABC transporter n=1 Tax=Fulvivirga imtechensis AK7 TaxID=1237149 RepID=L8JY24_9BACT|nr:ABC transporter ATP-binding protein [Fulvivirga imtechensis]ELR72112.1 ABC transporter [Fulvivirga imtechensis AK7]
MTFLTVSGVSKSFASVRAVNDVSLTVDRGEILAIVGENGSGKTTLLRLIAGLEDVDSGEIFLDQEKVTGPAFNLVPGHKEIRILAQDLHLFPKHNVAENIGYDLRGYVQEFQEERTADLINLLRLQGLEEKLPYQLSGGQQQRAALARALADEAPLLLLDEPFSSLDVMLKDEIKTKVIRKAKNSEMTLIFITHDIKEALSLADKIAVMKGGKVVQIDMPQRIYEKPVDEYVAYLFGSVNVFLFRIFLRVFPKMNVPERFREVDGRTKVCLRPEHIILCKAEVSMGEGIVQRSSYLGDHWELEVITYSEVIKIRSRKCYSEEETVFFKVNPSKIHIVI